ncbi:MAG: hypothetical protein QM750_00435 [Rubrivivax sp.]
MATSQFPDPLQLWRDALTKLEKEANALATGSTQSPEIVRSLHGFSAASFGIQQIVEKAIGAYLRSANLPSRTEVAELGAALQRIEHKLDRLLPADPAEAASRPARTRRPPPKAEAAPVPEPVVPAKPAAKRRPKR